MKVLLVEDDLKIAEFINDGLIEEGFSISHCSNGRLGLHAAEAGEFDVIIADIMMPEMNGISMIDKLRARGDQTPVIILSAKNSVDDRIEGLKKGGDDYLVKPFAMAELIIRLQALVRRSHTQACRFYRCDDLEVDVFTREVTRSKKHIDLQPKEYALLEYMIKRQGKVITRRMIMENVWGYNFDPGTNVVDARLCKLRDRIDRNFENKLIHTIRGAGYTLKKADS